MEYLQAQTTILKELIWIIREPDFYY